jgi:hypothetical protein
MQLGALDLPTEHGELVAQDQDLGLGDRGDPTQPQDAADDRVEERVQHGGGCYENAGRRGESSFRAPHAKGVVERVFLGSDGVHRALLTQALGVADREVLPSPVALMDQLASRYRAEPRSPPRGRPGRGLPRSEREARQPTIAGSGHR